MRLVFSSPAGAAGTCSGLYQRPTTPLLARHAPAPVLYERASERALVDVQRTTTSLSDALRTSLVSSRLALAAMSELLGKFFGKDKDGKQGGKARDKSPAVGEPGAGTSAAAQGNSGAADFCTYRRRSLLFILIY